MKQRNNTDHEDESKEQQAKYPTRKRIALQSTPNGCGNRTTNIIAYKKSCNLIDLSSYKQIQMMDKTEESIEIKDRVVMCQAKVTMEELVHFTLQHQCIPKVVAEFRNITVGGAISGSAIESTSHAYGQFMDTVLWVKIRKGLSSTTTEDDEEEIIVKSMRPNHDTVDSSNSLWCGVSGTYGSLGIVLEAALECVPALPYVKVSYYAFDNITNATTALLNATKEEGQEHAFLDGLIFPSQQIRHPIKNNKIERKASVIMLGEFVGTFQDPPLRRNRIGWKIQIRGGSFYYEHVRDLLQHHISHSRHQSTTGSPSSSTFTLTDPIYTEWIPIEDYLFRYDYGAFWMARPMAFEVRKLFSYFPFIIGLFVASYRWVRILTGSLFTTRNLFRALQSVPQGLVASKMVVQDCYMPPNTVNKFLSWVSCNIPLTTPLWLCPVKTNRNQPFTPSYNESESMMINCGIYGRVSDGKGALYTQQLENKCHELGGRKMLYAQNHYSESIFWKIYNKTTYDKFRQQHDATETFPSIYEKTCGVPERTNTWMETIISLFL